MEASQGDMLGPDPFADSLGTDAIPRVPVLATPAERRALINELRGLIESGNYEVDADVVAVAVLRDGRWDYE